VVDQEIVTEFVNNAHGNLARVRELLAARPELLNERSALGESALAAAAHVGNREIARFLLAAGAPLDVCTAAMLADRAQVAAFLEDPKQATAKGAHGIPLMFHVALGGDVEIAEMVRARGGEVTDQALHGAVAYGHLAMVEWLLAHGVQDVNRPNFQQKTPLSVALERGHAEVADLLRQHGGQEQAAL
jgi:ankyrin repeat protein